MRRQTTSSRQFRFYNICWLHERWKTVVVLNHCFVQSGLHTFNREPFTIPSAFGVRKKVKSLTLWHQSSIFIQSCFSGVLFPIRSFGGRDDFSSPPMGWNITSVKHIHFSVPRALYRSLSRYRKKPPTTKQTTHHSSDFSSTNSTSDQKSTYQRTTWKHLNSKWQANLFAFQRTSSLLHLLQVPKSTSQLQSLSQQLPAEPQVAEDRQDEDKP